MPKRRSTHDPKRPAWPRKADDQLALMRGVAREDTLADSAPPLIQRALAGKVGLVAAVAAELIGRHGLTHLGPDMAQAFDRLTEDGKKRDPNCRAKVAIVEAMMALPFDGEAIYRRGVRLIQLEPMWGPPVDTAPLLRTACARGLLSLRVPDVMEHLVDLLADREREARIGAAGVLRESGRREAALVLRLKARLGDPEPEVTAACFEGILDLDDDGVPFVAEHLAHHDGAVVDHALLSLGHCRRDEALPPLLAYLEALDGPAKLTKVALTAIVAHRSEAAQAFLTKRLAEAEPEEATVVLEAWAPMAFDPKVAEAVRVATAGRPELRDQVEALFVR